MLPLQHKGSNEPKIQIGVDVMKKMAYGIKEAAEYVSVSKTHMHRMVKEGVIRSVQLGNRKLIPASDLEAFIANQNHLVIQKENGEVKDDE
jgi:excisionase family DNA binding protein